MFWIVFVPRAIWADKPVVTEVASDLNDAVFRFRSSNLAPTVFGEAYWNGGWWMVCFVGMFLGCVFYILTCLTYFRLKREGLSYLPLAILGMIYGQSIESWFVPTYVGGLPLMVVMWYFLKWFFPKWSSTKNRDDTRYIVGCNQ